MSFCEVYGLQTPAPSQQPLGQLAAVQRHWPLWQTWPTAHALVVPHLQAPLAQLSAVVLLQVVQVPPAVPQLAALFR